MHQSCSGKLCGDLGNSAKSPSGTPPQRRDVHDDTNLIMTGRKRAARKRHCNGTAYLSQAVNRVAKGHEPRRDPEAWHASKVAATTALAHSAAARRARPKRGPSVEHVTPSATAEVVRATAALRLHRTCQLRAYEAREGRCTCTSSSAASDSEAMLKPAARTARRTRPFVAGSSARDASRWKQHLIGALRALAVTAQACGTTRDLNTISRVPRLQCATRCPSRVVGGARSSTIQHDLARSSTILYDLVRSRTIH